MLGNPVKQDKMYDTKVNVIEMFHSCYLLIFLSITAGFTYVDCVVSHNVCVDRSLL